MTCLVDLHRYRNGSTDEFSDRGPPNDILFFMDHIGFLNDCQRILDAGSGVGNVVQWLREQGRQATGLTYNTMEVRFAKTPLDYGDIHQMPYEDGSFDGAICWDVLEHCVAPLIALKELHRVLVPDGKLLLFVPGQPWVECGYHVLVPTIRQTLWLLRLAGFVEVGLTDYSNSQDQMAIYHVLKKAP